ncbi:MAG TPA: hypothetical protein VLA19_21985 [Herpetosiphonaceae bacterium]|nr:hypothetical protein [Herpetosiphonaceae bacterium]
MQASTLQPLADVPMNAQVIPLPKADSHIHAEADARLDRVLARRRCQLPYDWRTWAKLAT